MLLPTTIILLITLGAGALALPASQNDPTGLFSPSVIEERALENGGMGSIAAFPTFDCRGPPKGERPQDQGNNECIKFASGTDMIGINWGNSDDETTTRGIGFYKDDNCKIPHSTLTPANQQLFPRTLATNICVSPMVEKGEWLSVQFFH